MKQNIVQRKVWKRWCCQLLSALDCLASHNIIHGALAPDRLYIQPDGLTKLGDPCLGNLKKRLYFVTNNHAFIAPEFYRKDEPITLAADIYSFGMMVLQFATNETPYSECSSVEDLTQKVLSGNYPASLNKIEYPLRNLIEKCLRPAKERPTAQDLKFDPFFYEVPSLKVLTAWYIIHHRIEERYGNQQLRAEDKKFLNEVSSGVWGSLPNALQRGSLSEFRKVKADFRIFCFDSNRSIQAYWDYNDGTRRVVHFKFIFGADTSRSIAEELVCEGLLSAEDKKRFAQALELSMKKSARRFCP